MSLSKATRVFDSKFHLLHSFQEFPGGESVDLYDDVIAGGTSTNGDANPAPGLGTNSASTEPAPNHTPYNATNGPPSNIPIKRFQLYVGNLTRVR